VSDRIDKIAQGAAHAIDRPRHRHVELAPARPRRTSPVMAAGLEKRLWSMEDVVAPIDAKSAKGLTQSPPRHQ
jgi:hypothetical protein